MIVEMIAVLVMQVAIVDEIDVVAVLHGHLPSPRMGIACEPRAQFLGIGIGIADFDYVFIDVPVMRVVEMTVVQIVDMALMIDRLMAAALGVDMAFVPGMKHFMRKNRCCNKGKRQSGADQGSFHVSALQEV
ncbi:MAG: hypothetical protein ACKO1O_14760 [Erythrobacter sp.]